MIEVNVTSNDRSPRARDEIAVRRDGHDLLELWTRRFENFARGAKQITRERGAAVVWVSKITCQGGCGVLPSYPLKC